ncbi:MAG: hypothetical protein EGQ20_18170 [Bacteroides oleiciplenus]|nr:hypothetical protein [Bacteroides oleiciplenus]
MDGILQFLLIAGIIVIGIVKQFKKEAKKNADNSPAMPIPEEDMDDTAMPIPQGWGKTYGGYIPEGPEQEPEPAPIAKKEYQFSASKHIFGRDSEDVHPQHAATPPKQKISPPPPASQNPATDSEYSIHSAEEARKAIIWSEILQRKY